MKSPKRVLKLLSASLVLLGLLVTSNDLIAMDGSCSTTLKEKTGTVRAAVPARIKVTPTSNSVTIKIKKTGGRAATQVSFYVNNTMRVQKTEQYVNGNFTESQYRTITLNNVQNKEVKVEVVNQSVGNKFMYSMKIDGESNVLSSTGSKLQGTLVPQQNKTIFSNASCTNQTRMIVRRNGGKARANIRVWEQLSNGTWRRMDQHTKTLEKDQDKKIFIVNSSNPLKLELRNVSAANRLTYTLNAVVPQ